MSERPDTLRPLPPLLSGRPGPMLGILTCAFVVMLIAIGGTAALLPALIPGLSPRTLMLVTASLQAVGVFILPAWIMARLSSLHPWTELGLAVPCGVRPLLGVILFYIVALPALNQIIYWNASMHLPSSMSAVEAQIRAWEESASAASAVMLNTDSPAGLIWGIIVVGVLTGIAEETFFRGALQTTFSRLMPAPWALLLAAVIFSAVHFQFFGFAPRLLLGAWFGLLLIRTGSLIPAAAAHALNNSMVVLTTWLATRGHAWASGLDTLGVATDGFPFIASASAVATALLWIACRRSLFSPHH